MNLLEAIKGRRSTRRFKDIEVEPEVIRELLDISIWAPTASNVQPWGFVVIQDKNYLQELSTQAKADNLERMKGIPRLEQYKASMENPNFNIFYNASTLILIYGKKEHLYTIHDCSMAAQNLMLAAWDKGLGTCWIGFSHGVCDSDSFKEQHNVPQDYKLVAPVIVGYREDIPLRPVSRREYPVFQWTGNNS
ncbi:MAG: nitroreductase [Desulfitobacterium hafniense]|nr:nitroreductase [Desulfitobacterium hafniense]